jgi:hypothetical protein
VHYGSQGTGMIAKRLQLVAISAILSLSTITVAAAPITLSQINNALAGLEAQMETIFNVSVGATASLITDISFLPVITAEDSVPGFSFLTVNNLNEQNALLNEDQFGLLVPENVVIAYIVDEITYCGGSSPSTIGCANFFDNTMYLEGEDLLSSLGDELWAHELGHNFGLPHISSSSNVMLETIGNGHVNLIETQLIAINANSGNALSLIQGGTVTIQTVLVIPEVLVPVPAALTLFALPGLIIARFGLKRRKQRFIRASA